MIKFPTTLLAALVLLLSSHVLSAQSRTAVFPDYATFEKFVDDNVKTRNFIALFQELGAGREMSLSDLQTLNNQARKSFPKNFEGSALVRRETLENGFSHEARAYWAGESYAFVYIVLHERDGEIVVANFSIHGTPSPVMAMF